MKNFTLRRFSSLKLVNIFLVFSVTVILLTLISIPATEIAEARSIKSHNSKAASITSISPSPIPLLGNEVPIITNIPSPTSTPVPPSIVTPTPTSVPPTPTLVYTPTPVLTSSLRGQSLWVNLYSQAVQSYQNLLNTGQNDNAYLVNKISSRPAAIWLGNWNTNVESDVKGYTDQAASSGKVTVFVIYNIPYRDASGGYSSGGSQAATDYSAFVDYVAKGIGGKKAAVILEPDALADLNALSITAQQERMQMINSAVSRLKMSSNTYVYIDAGHSGWVPVDDMANRLNNSGIAKADGFALNASNYITTTDNINYGNQLSSKLGGKHYVIDTSRNGNGPTSDYQWCNPRGRALGESPTTNTGNNLIDAYLWIKAPGESDGNCNGGPSAGQWWLDIALELARNAKY